MLAGFISGGISSTAEQGAGAAIRKVTAPNAYVRGEKIKYDRAGSKNNTVEVDAANQNVDIIDENGNIVNLRSPIMRTMQPIQRRLHSFLKRQGKPHREKRRKTVQRKHLNTFPKRL